MRRTGKRAFEPTMGSEGIFQVPMAYSIFISLFSRSLWRAPGSRRQGRIFTNERISLRAAGSGHLPKKKKRAPEGARPTKPFRAFSLACSSVLTPAADRLRRSCDLLAVQADVETFPLLVLGDAQAD